jgi:hypothetical protein
MAVIFELRSRTPRFEPAPSSLIAKRNGVFRASLLQSLARGSDAREAVMDIALLLFPKLVSNSCKFGRIRVVRDPFSNNGCRG